MNEAVVFLHNNRSGGTPINLSFLDYTKIRGRQIPYNKHSVFKFGTLGDKDYQWSDFFREAKEKHKKYFVGHMVYGVHHYMGRPAKYFVNVRPTVERLLSGFRRNWDGRSDPKSWLMSYWETDNGMTKRLAGYGYMDGKVYDFLAHRSVCKQHEFRVTSEVFERAMHALTTSISSVILHRDLVSGLVLLEKKFHLPPLFCFRKQYVNSSHDRGVQFDHGFLREINELNEYDNAIYERCEELFLKEYSSISTKTKNYISLRKRLDKILFYKEKEHLSTDEVLTRIKYHLSEIHDKGDDDLAYELSKLILKHPMPDRKFCEEILDLVRTFLNAKRRAELSHYIETPSRLP